MAEKAEKTKTEIGPSASWEDIVREAKDLPPILPKLRFGKTKTDEVRMDVQILEDQPRFITFPDPFNNGKQARALVINVRVLSAEGTNNSERPGNERAVMMKVDPSYGLTRGILAVAKKHGSRLKDVCVRIETTVYKHKVFGDTRGYVVTEVSPPSAPAP